MRIFKQDFALEDLDTEKHRFICRDCDRETNHLINASYKADWSDSTERFEVQGYVRYQIIQCLGCETVSFRQVSSNSEDYDFDYDGITYNENVVYYPVRAAEIKSFVGTNIPLNVQSIYNETAAAIENKQNILAGIGVRALIETICGDLNAKGANLNGQIDWLHQQSIVTKEGAEMLHKLRVVGNDSAHRVKAHTNQQLLLALQIIEHMLEGTYIMPKKVASIFSGSES